LVPSVVLGTLQPSPFHLRKHFAVAQHALWK
jgi:hypothetical protein